MDDPDHSTRDERTDDGSVPARTTGELPEISCTLTTDQAERRVEWVEENLLPHLRGIEEREDGFTFAFERTEDAYAAVSEIAWKESQCCSWATFEVELPPGDAPIRWHERADRDEGTELFGDALEEMREELELPTPD